MRRGGILVILVCVAISGTVVGQEKAMRTAIESPRTQDHGSETRATQVAWLAAAQKTMESELAAKYGQGQRGRVAG